MNPDSNTSDSADRLERLAARRIAAQTATLGTRSRRSHAAKGSRIAALVLSLVTTGALATGFSALDGPGGSRVTEVGGVVAVAPVSSPVSKVVNGDVYTNKWGPVQVQVTFDANGDLTAIDALQVPSRDRKSVRINDRAVPVLNSEALVAQSATVDTVSGATYTSFDYQRSLQSAIDAARSAGITTIA